VITNPFVSAPASVNRTTTPAAALVLMGPAGFTAIWTITDGTHVLTGTTAIGADGTTRLTVDLSTLVDGTLTITIEEIDPYGNHESHSSTIAKETVGPTLAASISAATYDVGASTPITWTASDASGIASVRANVDSSQTITANGGAIDIDQLTAGAHTVVVTATDTFGNVTTKTLTFTIVVTAPGLKAAVQDGIARGWVPNATFQSTLLSQIQSVVDVAGKTGNTASVRIRTFISTVTNATSTQLTAAFKALLLNWANDLATRL
jgi:hypothetical protein